MRHISNFVCLLCFWCVSMAGYTAEPWNADNLSMPHLEDARRWTCNPDGVLSLQAQDSIDAVCAGLYASRGIELVVVAVEYVEGGDVYTFGMNLGKRYGIGSKSTNSGVIVVLSRGDRSYYILTGTGIEGTLPDAICKRIENRIMLPLLKNADWDGALFQTVKAIRGYIVQDETWKTLQPSEGEEDFGFLSFVFLSFCLFAFFLAIYFGTYKPCPKCKKRALQAVSRKFLRTSGNRDFYNVTYVCKKCSYKENKIEQQIHNDGGSGGAGPFVTGSILGGMRGGGFSGGGFGGGHFGGGMFGGGGAGGHF